MTEEVIHLENGEDIISDDELTEQLRAALGDGNSSLVDGQQEQDVALGQHGQGVQVGTDDEDEGYVWEWQEAEEEEVVESEGAEEEMVEEEEVVEVETFDNILNRIEVEGAEEMVKLEVQGAEEEVLEEDDAWATKANLAEDGDVTHGLENDEEGLDFFMDVDGGPSESTAGGQGNTAESSTTIKVPIDAVEDVIGPDGKNLEILASKCGAQLSIISGGGDLYQMVLGRGSPEVVASAHRLIGNLIQQALAEKKMEEAKTRMRTNHALRKRSNLNKNNVDSSAGAGGAQGCCKWFAAGFCRNHATNGVCSNGAHDADAILAAERAWISDAKCSAGEIKAVGRPVLLLLDLEGGGNQNGQNGEDEIIEIPVLAMCPTTAAELGRFHHFVRPGYWDQHPSEMRQKFQSSCFNGASNALPFPVVIQVLLTWIAQLLAVPEKSLKSDDFLFVTCGDWDVRTMLPRQCDKPTKNTVDRATKQLLFSRWCNLKDLFRTHFKLTPDAAPTGMRGMLNRLSIPLAGQHHLGMDDVSNLAKVLRTLILKGASVAATGSASERHKMPSPAQDIWPHPAPIGSSAFRLTDRSADGEGVSDILHPYHPFADEVDWHTVETGKQEKSSKKTKRIQVGTKKGISASERKSVQDVVNYLSKNGGESRLSCIGGRFRVKKRVLTAYSEFLRVTPCKGENDSTVSIVYGQSNAGQGGG